MFKYSGIITGAVLFLLLMPEPSAGEEFSLLNDLIDEAVSTNPRVQAAKASMKASRQAVSPAGALDDPKLKIGVDNLPVSSPSFSEFLPTSKVVGISQKIPFPGKLSLKEAAALKTSKSKEAVFNDTITDITERVKSAYFDLFFIVKSIEINKRNKKLLEDLSNIAATKYSVGKGLQQDVLKAQVELSKIINDLVVLRQKRKTAKADLNTLLNRSLHTKIADPPAFKPTVLKLSEKELGRISLKNSFMLAAAGYEVERRKDLLNLARKEYYPDFDFSVVYKQREDGSNFKGDDWVSGFVTVNIPIYFRQKQNRRVLEAKASLNEAKSRYKDIENDLLFKVKDAFLEVKKEKKLIELYKTGFLPQARQSLDSAISGYQVDKVDFLTLIDNQLTLLRFELAYYRTIVNYEKQLARLENIIDKRLF